ncbi:hypothetical protein BDR05DRAFT_185297 [Suillus weaverae]|nr:hypothetical protein BDR05DRAFT_185297 [Suillus weaverae]
MKVGGEGIPYHSCGLLYLVWRLTFRSVERWCIDRILNRAFCVEICRTQDHLGSRSFESRRAPHYYEAPTRSCLSCAVPWAQMAIADHTGTGIQGSKCCFREETFPSPMHAGYPSLLDWTGEVAKHHTSHAIPRSPQSFMGHRELKLTIWR